MRIQAAGASVVAISPQTVEKNRATAGDEKVAFPVLSDAGSVVARRFRVARRIDPDDLAGLTAAGVALSDHNGEKTDVLPIPATFVVDRRGLVAAAYVDPDYANRLAVDEVVAVVRRLTHQQPPAGGK